jgi:decaprenylphospho-beta-D-ribofuranose 2-oxidase
MRTKEHFETLSGWGRFPVASCSVRTPDSPAATSATMMAMPSFIARGNGRSYGDASLNPEGVVAMRRLDHILAFDAATGLIVCEGGVMLSDLIEIMLPRGWFAPVTPGTRYVTIGGMIASDVHGKNHHGSGSFADHVHWIDLALPSGEVLRASQSENPDAFAATCGGMGLTGIILRAAFGLLKVETARIRQKIAHARTLDDAFQILEAAQGSTYSVAWIDGMARGASLGRSVVFLGEHATLEDLPNADQAEPFRRSVRRTRRVPLDFPSFALSRVPVTLFNQLYYRSQTAGEAICDLYPYFYPLDAVHDWNRIYGRSGFIQYQCVLPLSESLLGMARLLSEIASAGGASFLSVLKRMGPESFGFLSFPMDGYTLAMDFRGDHNSLALLNRLDVITAELGGRTYLAKDARTTPHCVAQGYPRLEAFKRVRQQLGLKGRVESLLSRRLGI